MRINRKFL